MADDTADPADTKEAPKLGISTTQVAASALAAVSAAVFASWFGTTGTLIGAALGSVVATVGSATYSYSLQRTSAIARRTAAQVREGGVNLRASLPRPGHAPGERPDDTQVLPADTQAETETSTSWKERLDPRGKDLPWGKVALASAAVMLVAMLVITGFEGLTGRSVSSYTGDDSGRTTVGNVFDDSDRQTDEPTDDPSPTQAPSEEPSESPTDDATAEPTEEPSESPSSTPSSTPSSSPSSTPSSSPSPSTGSEGGPAAPSASPTD